MAKPLIASADKEANDESKHPGALELSKPNSPKSSSSTLSIAFHQLVRWQETMAIRTVTCDPSSTSGRRSMEGGSLLYLSLLKRGAILMELS